MFNKTIFKQTLKQNWKLWAIFTAITAAMGGMIIAVFNPEQIQQMMDTFAELGIGGMMAGETFSLIGMVGDMFYGMQGYILPLVFVLMTANSLIASQVDRGSMAYTLSTPIKRVTVVCTQALYLILAVFAMFAVVTVVGLIAVQAVHGGNVDFDTMTYINLNLGIALLLFAVSGISFLFSCVFNLTKNALLFGAGIPMAFFILEIMSGTSEDFENLRYLSLNTLYDPAAVTGGGTFLPQFIVMAGLGAVLYLLGIWIFKEKDLPL